LPGGFTFQDTGTATMSLAANSTVCLKFPASGTVVIPIGSGGGGGGGGVIKQNVAVAGAPVTITASAGGADGLMLIVQITQDATGYAITWDAGFVFAPPVPTTALLSSLITFAGNSSDGKWYCTGSVLGRKV
jgi:hypothetical protein